MIPAVEHLPDTGALDPGQLESGPITTTLLDLVHAVAESSKTDEEAVATLHHILASGRVSLLGEFQAKDLEQH